MPTLLPNHDKEPIKTEDEVAATRSSFPYKLDHGNPKYPSNILCQDEPFLKCSRQCKHYNNRLVYTHTRGNGLKDRNYIFSLLLEMGAYLCATVYVPRPIAMLGGVHNNNTLVSPSLTWSDFFHSEYHHLGGGMGADPLPAQELFEWNASLENDWRTQDNTTGDFEYQEINSFKNFDVGFDQAANYSMSDNRPFVWYVRGNWWQNGDRLTRHIRKTEDAWETPLRLPLSAMEEDASKLQDRPQPNDPTNLIYTPNWDRQKPPEQFEGLVDQLWNEVVFPNNAPLTSANQELIIGSWHIRRADTRHKCNTDLDRMRSYINCTLVPLAHNRTHGSTNKRILVLIFSDEKDPEYHTGLEQAFQEVAPQITAITGIDAKILAFLQQTLPAKYHNNFHVYLLSNLIAARKAKAFHLVHRRTFDCKDCYDLKGELQLHQPRQQLRWKM